MSGLKLQKRAHDLFVSYGHSDLPKVAPIVDFLRRPCGLAVWFDGQDGNAAMRSSELLGEAIGNARGILIFLSTAWQESSWCRDEHEVARSQQRSFPGFEIVTVRIDDTTPPHWLNSAEIVDLRRVDSEAMTRLLSSLSSDVPRRLDNSQDVYLAAPWSRPTPRTEVALNALTRVGWRLVGDSPTYAHLGPDRVQRIMETTRGVVAVLPFDEQRPPTNTSPFILEEAELAVRCASPLLLLAEAGVVVPDTLVAEASDSKVVVLSQDDAAAEAALDTALQVFDEELELRPLNDAEAYVFLASSVQADRRTAEQLVRVIEAASNMTCDRGERLRGSNAPAEIAARIGHAAVVIADITDDRRNTMIEVGIALGTNTPLRVIVHAPDGVVPKKPFMLEGFELFGYRTPEERLGLCYWIARQFRRMVYARRS